MATHMSDAGGTGDPTETLEMDWPCSPQTSRHFTRQTLTWNTEGKGKRGRPGNTWRRGLEADVKETGYTGRQLERLTQDRSICCRCT